MFNLFKLFKKKEDKKVKVLTPELKHKPAPPPPPPARTIKGSKKRKHKK